jgi:hypothetical protein
MTQFTVEIAGGVHIRYEDYLGELSNQELYEPRLVALRRNLGEGSRDTRDARSAALLGNTVDTELFELLRSHEDEIGRNIQSSLEQQDWRRRRRRGMLDVHDEPSEPLFRVSVRFGRGSLLYTVVVTFMETFGPTIAKTGLASLAVAAVEPIILNEVRRVCNAASSMTSYVRDVIVQSVAQPVAGPAATWADDKVRDVNDRLDQLIKKLDETRTYRRWRALALIIIGLVIANFVALVAVARKLGLL